MKLLYGLRESLIARAARLEAELTVTRNMIAALEAYEAIDFVTDEESNRRKPTMNLLLQVLENGPASATDIARAMYRGKLIVSGNGYRGVYATVSTTLRRNTHLVVQKGLLWQLKKAREPLSNGLMALGG